MKCTGDGFFAVYRAVPEAAEVALSFLDRDVLGSNRFRVALHRGMMKIGPGGDPLGSEVHRVFRMESVQEKDRADRDMIHTPLPEENRILTSKNALDEMTPAQSKRFQPVGTFHLKGFDNPTALWATYMKEKDKSQHAR